MHLFRVNFGTLLIAFALFAFSTSAYPAEGDMSLGDPSAPVTVIEYASMTCPHCASFHQDNFLLLKSEFIETGKVYFIFREFPLDNLALAASVLARCSGPERFFPFIDILFEQQSSWTRSENPIQSLSLIGQRGGLGNDAFMACLDNVDLVNAIANSRLEAENQYNVSSTPTFIVNGVTVSGNLPWEEFSNLLELAAKGQNIQEDLEPPTAEQANNPFGTVIAISLVLSLLVVVAIFFLRQPRNRGS